VAGGAGAEEEVEDAPASDAVFFSSLSAFFRDSEG
jgi:hypothetical protein